MKEKRASVRFSLIGSTLRADIKGEIDHHSAKHIREEIDGQMYALKPKEVTINLSSVDFMDSSGLGLIVGRLVTAKEVEARLHLCGVSGRIQKIFEMAGLERMRGLSISTTEEKRKEP